MITGLSVHGHSRQLKGVIQKQPLFLKENKIYAAFVMKHGSVYLAFYF